MNNINKLIFILIALLFLIASFEVMGQVSTVQPSIYKIALSK